MDDSIKIEKQLASQENLQKFASSTTCTHYKKIAKLQHLFCPQVRGDPLVHPQLKVRGMCPAPSPMPFCLYSKSQYD